MTPTNRGASSHGSFAHEAFLFASEDEWVRAAVRHLRAGRDAGEHLVIACHAVPAARIVTTLGRGPEVTVLAADDAYSGPIPMAQAYLDLTRRVVAQGATGVRIVGQLPAGTEHAPHTWPGWARAEAVVNHVLGPLPFNALCGYGLAETDPSVLGAVRRTHRHLWEDGERSPSADFLEPADCLSRWADAPYLPVEATTPHLEVHDIARPEAARAARQRLQDLLAELDTALQPFADELPPADPSMVEVEEYLIGVDEVLTNALTHGLGPVTVRVWVQHDRVVTTITDRGVGVDDQFLGFTMHQGSAADPAAMPGMGLWLARQMCDELSFRLDDEGFTVRLRAELDVRA